MYRYFKETRDEPNRLETLKPILDFMFYACKLKKLNSDNI